jgi:hypothetical protein
MRSAQVQNAQRAQGPSQPALTPEQIWSQVVQPKRGFEARRYNADDRYRGIPAAPLGNRLDPGVRGGQVGFGVDTVGSVQLVDATGERSWIAVGHFTGGGPEFHAEIRSLNALRNQAPQRLQGSRLVVVVDQLVCPTCRQALTDYAQSVGVESIEIYHPRLENAATRPGSGILSGPKTSSKRSLMGPDPARPRPPLQVRLEETIAIERPPGGGPSGASGATRLSAGERGEGLGPPTLAHAEIRTAIKGACLNIAGSVAIGIFQEKFKAYMVDELASMPKPQIDSRSAQDFFTDPRAGKAMRVIDLLNKNLGPFSTELAEHHQSVITVGVLELMLLRASSIDGEERIQFLTGFQDELGVYEEDLRTAEANLEAANALSGRALEAAQAAEDLTKMVDRVIVLDWLVKQGFSLDEIVQMYENLTQYSLRVRRVFQRLDELQTQVARQRRELAELQSNANGLYWQAIFRRLARGERIAVPAPPTAQTDSPSQSAGPKNVLTKTPALAGQAKTIPVAPLR